MQIDDSAHVPDWASTVHSALDEKMGLVLTELTPDSVRGSMPVEGNTQPIGLWHGGASGVLIETLCSLGSAAHGYPDKVAVGVDLNVTHIHAVRSGRVHGHARALRHGRRVVNWQVDLTDDDGRLVAVGRLTCQLVAAPAK